MQGTDSILKLVIVFDYLLLLIPCGRARGTHYFTLSPCFLWFGVIRKISPFFPHSATATLALVWRSKVM